MGCAVQKNTSLLNKQASQGTRETLQLLAIIFKVYVTRSSSPKMQGRVKTHRYHCASDKLKPLLQAGSAELGALKSACMWNSPLTHRLDFQLCLCCGVW